MHLAVEARTGFAAAYMQDLQGVENIQVPAFCIPVVLIAAYIQKASVPGPAVGRALAALFPGEFRI